jgi:hypothetical protein
LGSLFSPCPRKADRWHETHARALSRGALADARGRNAKGAAIGRSPHRSTCTQGASAGAPTSALAGCVLQAAAPRAGHMREQPHMGRPLSLPRCPATLSSPPWHRPEPSTAGPCPRPRPTLWRSCARAPHLGSRRSQPCRRCGRTRIVPCAFHAQCATSGEGRLLDDAGSLPASLQSMPQHSAGRVCEVEAAR